MFKKGEIYRRREIHEKYGGQEQGGISTPANYNMIFLFTSDRGEEHGYLDGWVDQRHFAYTGEGQYGDMTFTRGNRAIRDHLENGKELHLFSQVSKGYVEYVGQMIYRGHRIEEGPDTLGNMRKVIIFDLELVE